MTAIIRIIAVLGVLFASGCACGPSFNWKGKWVGNRELTPQPGDDPVVLFTLGKVEVTIKDNGTFEAFEGGEPFAGTVSYSGNTATLEIRQKLGKELDETLTARLEALEDGTVRFVNPNSIFTKPAILTREE